MLHEQIQKKNPALQRSGPELQTGFEHVMLQSKAQALAAHVFVPLALTQTLITNDRQAVVAFIKSKGSWSEKEFDRIKEQHAIEPGADMHCVDWTPFLSSTQRAYLKEVERFLMWADIKFKKSIREISPEDCNVYRLFIQDPQPSRVWCGARGNRRSSESWRPFEGPLSASAARVAGSILKTFYTYLLAHNYVQSNPWLAPNPKRDTADEHGQVLPGDFCGSDLR